MCIEMNLYPIGSLSLFDSLVNIGNSHMILHLLVYDLI